MRAVVVAISLLMPVMGFAAPASYVLQPENSTVGYETDFGVDKIRGTMPVTRADLTLDFDMVSASTISVTLDVAGADASFPFAAQALKGPKVLDADRFPTMTFQSTSVRAKGDGAVVEGTLTIRGIAKPVTMQAEIYRQKGYLDGDLSHLTIRMRGAVMRSDFGATGWSDMVGDQVRLDILARIARVD